MLTLEVNDIYRIQDIRNNKEPNKSVLVKEKGNQEFFFFFFFFLGLQMWHMEVPRLGVSLELQLPAHARATATPDPSHV